MKNRWMILIVFMLSVIMNQFVFSQSQPKAWYVYKNATGLNDGTSWQNAWTSFGSINWSAMQDDDTLYISGGADSLVYTQSITVGRKNITITKGKSSGHDGRVILKAPTTASGIGIDIRNYDSIRVVGIEFQNWFTCVKFRSDNVNGITFGLMKDCKGITAGWVTEAVSSLQGDTSGTRIRNLWFINNDFVSINNSSYQTEFGSFGSVKNVFFIGNRFINYNNNPTTHDDFVQGNFNTNFYYINNFFRHDTTVTKVGNCNGLAGISNGGGDWYFINNILVEPPTSIGYPLMMFYSPIQNPTLYYRNWARVRIYNNTFCAAHPSGIRYGYDLYGEIKNNIIYSSAEWILYSSTSAGRNVFISIDECGSPNPDNLVIQNNDFYNNYTDAANPNGKVYPYLNCNPPTMHSSNTIYNRNATTLYSPFASNFRMSSINAQDFKIPAGSSAIGRGQTITGLTMHPDALSIIDPEYGTPLSNYRNSGKNLVQYFVERDFNGNLRDSQWDIGAFEYGGSQVLQDNDPPEVVSAQMIDSVTVRVVFSEPLEQSSANNPNNYTIDNSIIVNSVQFSGVVATLNTSVHSPGFYTIIVSNVRDTAGNVISSQQNSASYGYNPNPLPELLKFIPGRSNASAVADTSYIPEKTFDGKLYNSGDPTSRWIAQYLPQWVSYDLGNVIMLNKTRIQFYNWQNGRIYNYTIQVSTDSVNWTDVRVNIPSQLSEWTVETFEPTPARFVKIIVLSNNQSDWANVWEVEFYGQLMVSNNDDQKNIPSDFALNQNFPNPFNPSTTISWQSPVSGWQTLKVYDILGNEVATLVDEYREAGSYNLQFTINNLQLTSGIYFYQLRIGDPSTSSGSLSGSGFSTSSGSGHESQGFVETKKMILLK